LTILRVVEMVRQSKKMLVKLLLKLIKHHTMKMYWEMKLWLRSFINSALNEWR
jgi:hypothetical protein